MLMLHSTRRRRGNIRKRKVASHGTNTTLVPLVEALPTCQQVVNDCSEVISIPFLFFILMYKIFLEDAAG